MSDLAYRRELDGVRAIAVLSVVLFHVGYPDMLGGFVGVDIFFVLSGYLICGQTYMRLEQGTYSVTEFFARRIRRLSTAYALCFLVTALLANAFFLRSEMGLVADGFLGSITFTNNFNLLNSVGYFSAPAHENPFLHTWSLSIEEQFYIVLPMLILLTRRNRTVFAWLLGVLFVASLALTLFSGDLIYDREERFFSSTFRVWELAAGGLVFLVTYHRLIPDRVPLMPLVGLALVIAPVNLLDASYLYPGWATLLPVLGTVILIAFAAPGHSWIAKALAVRPMAYIGRISYGTYLWHWPVIVGALYYGVTLTDEIRAVLVLVSLGLGALSYHVVEMPIRRISVRGAGKTRLYMLFAGQALVLLGVAVYLMQQPGKAAAGEDARLEALKAEVMNVHDGWNRCWDKTTPATFCKLGVPGETPDYVLWGDSMANSAFAALDDYGKARDETGFLITRAACAPLLGAGTKEECIAFNDRIFAYLDEAAPMDVVMFARWSYYSEGSGHGGDRPGSVPLLRADGSVAKDGFALFEESLNAAIARVAARHRVIVINHVPEFLESVPKSMLRTMRFGSEPLHLSREAFDERRGRTIEAVARAAEENGALHVAPHELFCDDGVCHHEVDGIPLFIDNVHLGPKGNEVLLFVLNEALKKEGRP
ncbi:acyltransferase family protein [Roseovarius sp.]|uniref:acyltransferase family protein n=1 Tax=Roseovarius sp. TaxID=1486281 RepID=UPI003BAB92FF